MTKSTGRPPRPECLEEPCNAWMTDKCGHKVIYGQASCILDDPERVTQRAERMRRKAMEGR
ncbi:MAG: hypothetical protein V3573_14595 [Desulfovibrionaceae bacterium]